MKFLFSCTSLLQRYLKANMPRMMAAAGAQSGVNRLSSNATELAFQCHYLSLGSDRQVAEFVILIEAESRYCMILPLQQWPELTELTAQLYSLFLTHVGYQLFEAGFIEEADLTALEQLFVSMDPESEWLRNTDLSLQGGLTQIELFIRDAVAQAGKKGLSEQQVFALSLQFNETESSRTRNGKKQRFVPAPKFIAEMMLRFGPLFLQQQAPDNVVSLAAYRALKN